MALSLLTAAAAQPNRLAGRIDNNLRLTLKGHIHPNAVPENDEGAVDSAFVLSRITIELQPSAAQQADLKQLLADQQDPSSPNYHHWLTPDEYADRFGVTAADLAKITSWLEQQQFSITGLARSRNWIAVKGTAAAVQNAFGTEIHHYRVNGVLHFANAMEPSIPAAFQGVIKTIRGLHDFRMRPALRAMSSPQSLRPSYTSSRGNHYLGPDDVAVIYNIQPLYAAGYTGSGQKVAVAGQVDVDMTDIEQYRTYFNLPVNNPQTVLVPGSVDPGTNQNDLGEADLDLELAGAVARNAAILYVNSNDVMTSAQYAIDQNLAPVLSISYGSCEGQSALSDAQSLQSMAQQANAEGMTWFAASGDSGAADCSTGSTSRLNGVLSVDLPASVPEVTGVGGTTFNEGGGNYWSSTNTGSNASALSYIPETGWNDTATDGQPSSSGGGASVFFPKPSWQTGTGVPGDGARDVPDLAISASADHDGYLIFSGGSQVVVGGTSVGAPSLAGLAALMNQYLVATGAQSSPGLGNLNPRLYSLAQAAPAAYHDVTTGNNIITVNCSARVRNCVPGSIGYSAGVGYDQVTGLGTLDAYTLLTAWGSQTGAGSKGTPPPPSTGTPAITVLGNAASFNQRFTPGMLLTIYGSHLSPVTQAAAGTPWPLQIGGVSVNIGGIAAPLYYVSPGQLNVQIPFQTPLNTAVVLTVNNNGQTAASSFIAAASAPGIFTGQNLSPVPFSSAARGQIISLYITGFGSVTPSIGSGAGPAAATPIASLPIPVQRLTVTVGGVPAAVSFDGIPWGYVGVMQINYQVPSTAPLGPQPVVVTIGSISSTAATLTVTP